MAAERETNDRYLAAYLSERVGGEFTGRINGIQRFGVFVRLDETGADGLIPVRSIGDECFFHDRGSQSLTGEGLRSGTDDWTGRQGASVRGCPRDRWPEIRVAQCEWREPFAATDPTEVGRIEAQIGKVPPQGFKDQPLV